MCPCSGFLPGAQELRARQAGSLHRQRLFTRPQIV